jgi:hypothetical protein
MHETYDADARPGDIVRGGDGNVWRIAEMDRETSRGFSVTLERPGQRVTGWPPLGTEVEILQRAEVPHGTGAEVAALQALAAFGPVSLIREVWAE